MKAVTREDECLHICYVWQERISGIVPILQGMFITSTSYKMGKPRAGSQGNGTWEREVWLEGAGGKKVLYSRSALKEWETTRSQRNFEVFFPFAH